MTFVPIPDVAQANMRYTLPGGNVAENTLYWYLLGGWDTVALGLLTEALRQWHDTHVKTQQSNQVSLTSIVARELSQQDGLVYEDAIVPGQAGAVVSPVLPANVTLAIKFSTPFAGRSFRGRNYVVGLGEGQVAGDFIVAINGNAWITIYTGLADVEFDTGAVHVVVSRYEDGAPRTLGVATPVTGYSLEDFRVDTQRRRLIGEGA